jgi:hypothetical protein
LQKLGEFLDMNFFSGLLIFGQLSLSWKVTTL